MQIRALRVSLPHRRSRRSQYSSPTASSAPSSHCEWQSI